jgi:hypothetical protein
LIPVKNVNATANPYLATVCGESGEALQDVG